MKLAKSETDEKFVYGVHGPLSFAASLTETVMLDLVGMDWLQLMLLCVVFGLAPKFVTFNIVAGVVYVVLSIESPS